MSATSKNFLREIVPGKDAKIDIVAVHGLNPTNEEFHAETTWTSGDKLWLRDFLPKQLPKARVLLFGYNSNVAFETSTAGVREQAENLLNRLRGKRRGSPDRPIVFVCHSLGGIVVKRALVSAKLDVTYRFIAESTYGIAFFGTPHQGGEYAKLGDIAATIARCFLRNPGNTFLEALKKDSLFADDLIQDFRHQLEDYYVLSFYETREYNKLGLIVDKGSATLGLPGTRETRIALDADHAQICKFAEADGDAYEQVEDNLIDLAERATKAFSERQQLACLSTPLHVTKQEPVNPAFPYTNNPDFVGREKIIEQVKGLLSKQAPGVQPRAALFGLGGVGKTQIAIRYAYWIREKRPGLSVFWVHASNIDRINQAFADICKECGLPGASDPDADKLALARDWLKGKRSGEWLMIIDNADDVEVFYPSRDKANNENPEASQQNTNTTRIADYIPDCPHGSILVTTRYKAAAVKLTQNRGLVQVLDMTEMESSELLRRRLTGYTPESEDIKRLTTLLKHLPLALAQAAAYIQENSIAVSEYLELFTSNDQTAIELLDEDFEESGRDSATRNAVTATWMISFNQISKKDPRAAQLLSLMTFFDRQGIPKSLLQQPDVTAKELSTSLGTLKAFSLITQSESGNSFDMHSLVRLVTHNWLVKGNQAIPRAEEALDIMSDLFPNPRQSGNWVTCARYLPHAKAVIDCTEAFLKEAELRLTLISKVAFHFASGRTQLEEGVKLQNQLLEIRLRLLGEEHADTLDAMTDLAVMYFTDDQLKLAEDLQALVLKINSKLLQPDFERTRRYMARLMRTYLSQGRKAEVEGLFQQLEEMSKLHESENEALWAFVKDVLMNDYAQAVLEEAESLIQTNSKGNVDQL